MSRRKHALLVLTVAVVLAAPATASAAAAPSAPGVSIADEHGHPFANTRSGTTIVA